MTEHDPPSDAEILPKQIDAAHNAVYGVTTWLIDILAAVEAGNERARTLTQCDATSPGEALEYFKDWLHGRFEEAQQAFAGLEEAERDAKAALSHVPADLNISAAFTGATREAEIDLADTYDEASPQAAVMMLADTVARLRSRRSGYACGY